MKYYTVKEIEDKVKEIWQVNADNYDYRNGKIEKINVSIDPSAVVRITLSNMYEAPGLSFKHLMALSEFFDTKNINDDDRFSYGGCETCDYGSSYGFTLTIRPEYT